MWGTSPMLRICCLNANTAHRWRVTPQYSIRPSRGGIEAESAEWVETSMTTFHWASTPISQKCTLLNLIQAARLADGYATLADGYATPADGTVASAATSAPLET
ncbi:hypothetical protein DFH06DRAFT_1137933 [Mycena polygramma]|nr:hypothetical protein DFH06DRAFT_1137933 [Mycena polygramma]